MNMHYYGRFLNRLILGLLALTLVVGTVACFDSSFLSPYPEEIDDDDDGNTGTDEPADPGTGT